MTRVLLVEDSPTQMEELKFVLESDGFVVETATDGAMGLEKIRADTSFDVVISDIMMPKLNGFELCRAIKASPATRGVPVVLLTSLSSPMDVIEGLECGADNFLTKPYEPEHLLARVNGILENRRLRAASGLGIGVELMFMGRSFTINSDKEQILDLLVSMFEDTVRKNRELEQSQARLAATLSSLEAANQELETFSYSVSHDLRAPLRHIDGFAQILVEDYGDVLDPTGLAYLQNVRSGAQRMRELIDALLNLAHASRVSLNPRTLDVCEMVESIVSRQRLAEPSRRVELVLHDLPPCNADASLLRAVLENLLENAWKFTKQVEEARIEVGGLPLETGEVQLYVRDNGAGFDMQFAQKLFAPFQRLHGSEEFPGTGVGLATVQRIIHRHGGRIWAEAAPGKGATFRFTLPAADA